MSDLRSKKWIYAKAGMFVIILLIAAGLLILENPQLRTVFLVAV